MHACVQFSDGAVIHATRLMNGTVEIQGKLSLEQIQFLMGIPNKLFMDTFTVRKEGEVPSDVLVNLLDSTAKLTWSLLTDEKLKILPPNIPPQERIEKAKRLANHYASVVAELYHVQLSDLK
ncbi:Uncharacterised protein [uncultured archaeon]|nr:Uncharacterised protein [uncultured archaeon]